MNIRFLRQSLTGKEDERDEESFEKAFIQRVKK